MEELVSYFQSLDLDLYQIGITAGVLLLGTLLLSLFGRFVFGKRSVLNNAVSSAIGILFIYIISVVLRISGVVPHNFITPLPLVEISGEYLHLFQFQGAHYTTICSELLSIIILAFLVNLADGWMPKGKNVLTWFLFRCLTVVAGYLMHLIVVGLLATYLPEGLLIYAPVILLGLLVLLLLTGALKVVVGAVLTTVNPIIGGLYTFFFATIIGKQITRSVLTTAILAGLIYGLSYLGVTAISIASAALLAYIPFGILLIVLWYIVYKIF